MEQRRHTAVQSVNQEFCPENATRDKKSDPEIVHLWKGDISLCIIKNRESAAHQERKSAAQRHFF